MCLNFSEGKFYVKCSTHIHLCVHWVGIEINSNNNNKEELSQFGGVMDIAMILKVVMVF